MDSQDNSLKQNTFEEALPKQGSILATANAEDRNVLEMEMMAGSRQNQIKLNEQHELDKIERDKLAKTKKLEFVERKWIERNGVKKYVRIMKYIDVETKLLNMEQKDEIDNAFNVFDKDNSGSIDTMELKDALKALGIFQNKEQIKKTMQKVDKDGSGAIDREEFMVLMAEQIEERNQEEELRKVFRMYDDDDEGIITKTNLERVMQDLCDKDEKVTDTELETMV